MQINRTEKILIVIIFSLFNDSKRTLLLKSYRFLFPPHFQLIYQSHPRVKINRQTFRPQKKNVRLAKTQVAHFYVQVNYISWKPNLFKGKLILSQAERQAGIMSLLIDGVCRVNTVDLYQRTSVPFSQFLNSFRLCRLYDPGKNHRLLICFRLSFFPEIELFISRFMLLQCICVYGHQLGRNQKFRPI